MSTRAIVRSAVRSTDVVIVGAGFAGCATAWALAERGVRAIVLEREAALGRHASGRGAGLGRQLAEDDDTSCLAIRGAALLREKFSTHWRATGGMLAFDDPAACAVYVERARRLDVPHEVIDRAYVLRHWPQLGGLPIEAALLVPRDGVIAARGLLQSYARDQAIEYAVEVVRVESIALGVRIETRRQSARDDSTGLAPETQAIEARCIVDASGAWAGAVTNDPPLAVFKRHLFTVEATVLTDAPYLWHLGACEMYVRPDAGGVLACPCDADATPAIAQQASADADARLAARLPGWNPRVIDRWACQRAFAPDRKMRIGRDPERPWLVWAAALGGHGATASAAVGERAAAAVMEVLDERR